MPDYSDPVDAAQRRPQVQGGLGGAYNQTDVWHDRNWLLANIQSGNHGMARAAEIALNNLDRQEVLQQHANFRQQGLDLRGAALDQRQLDFEANQRRLLAHDSAQESHRQLSTDRETEIDEQGHALLQGMGQLDAALRNGRIDKSTYDDSLLQLGAQLPLATRHPEAARHFEFSITEADKQNAYNIRRQATQAAKLGAKYGIEPQVDPETGLPSVEHTQLAALQTPKGRNEALGQMNKEMALKYGVTTGVGSLFNPITPHVGTDAEGNQVENPTHVAIPFLQTTGAESGKVGKLPVPVPLFNQMKADFNDRYFALNPQSAAQPAGAVSNTGGQTAPAAIPNGREFNLGRERGTLSWTPQSNAAPAAIPKIGSADEYQALPAGSTFISNGKQYQKPAEQAQ